MLVAFSITPIGVGEGVAEEVAEAVRVVRESGLPNRTDAMFTTIEGDWDEAMDVVKRAVEAVAARAPRVSLVLKADLRPGVTGALTAKVEAVERYLQARALADGAGAGYGMPSRRSTAVVAAAAMTTTRNGALRQARIAADQHPGRAGVAGEAVSLVSAVVATSAASMTTAAASSSFSARGGKVTRWRSTRPDTGRRRSRRTAADQAASRVLSFMRLPWCAAC